MIMSGEIQLMKRSKPGLEDDKDKDKKKEAVAKNASPSKSFKIPRKSDQATLKNQLNAVETKILKIGSRSTNAWVGEEVILFTKDPYFA